MVVASFRGVASPGIAASPPEFYTWAKQWVGQAESAATLESQWEETIERKDASPESTMFHRFHSIAGSVDREGLIEIFIGKDREVNSTPDKVAISNADYLARLQRSDGGWNLLDLFEVGTPAWRENWSASALRGPWLRLMSVAGVSWGDLLEDQKLRMNSVSEEVSGGQEVFRYRCEADLSSFRGATAKSAIVSFDVARQAPHQLVRVREERPNDISEMQYTDYADLYGRWLPQRIKGTRIREENGVEYTFVGENRLVRVSNERGASERFRLPHYGLPEPAFAAARQPLISPTVMIIGLLAVLGVAGVLLRRSGLANN
jgi:hypothetical protein